MGIVAKGPVLFGFGDLRSKMQSNTHAARSTGNDGRGLSTASVDTFLLQVLPSLVFSCPVAVFVKCFTLRNRLTVIAAWLYQPAHSHPTASIVVIRKPPASSPSFVARVTQGIRPPYALCHAE